MKIKFLGVGGAFTMASYNTNLLIEQNGKNLLLDAGSDIRFSLRSENLSYKDIDALYLSHQHADHIGGVEYLAFTSYFDPSVKEKIQLFGNSKLIRDSWKSSLKGGLESIQGKVVGLSDYFDVNMIKANGGFLWEDIIFKTVQSVHIMNGREIVPTYGLMFHSEHGEKVYFTSDTQFCPNQIMDFYKEADVIIQDCETSEFKSGVHANYQDLKELPTEIKEKMILTHVGDNVLDELGQPTIEFQMKAEEDGFRNVAGTGLTIEVE